MKAYQGDGSQIGARVRLARHRRGWSLREGARRLRLSLRFLSELEAGKATARLDKVQQAMRGLGLELQVVERGPFALRDRVLAQKALLRRIGATHGVRRMSLFGSAARGEAGAASDLDFLVEIDRTRSLLDMLGFKNDLEALFERKVDVFTADTLKPRVLASSRRDLLRVF